MKKALYGLLIFLCLDVAVFAQAVTVPASAIKIETVSGTCRAGQIRLYVDGTLKVCASGTWSSAGGGGTTINSTNGRVPYRVNATTFGDSAISSNAFNATGIEVTSAAAGSGVTVGVTSSGSNENLNLNVLGTGRILLNTVNAPSIALASDSTTGIYLAGSGSLYLYANNVANVSVSNGLLRLGSATRFGFSSASNNFSADDVAVARLAAGAVRLTNGSTGAGNLLIGTTAGSIGTSGAGVLAFAASTAPSTSPTDTLQVYSGDAAAGDAQLFIRNEAGNEIRLTGTVARNASQFDKTSSTTLADVTGLSLNVVAGKTYSFEARLYTSSDSAGGVKAAIGGTATATSVIYEGLTVNAGTVTQSRSTSLGSAVGAVTAVTAAVIEIHGTITVNAGGTLTVQFAQNASNGTPSSVLVGSWLRLVQN